MNLFTVAAAAACVVAPLEGVCAVHSMVQNTSSRSLHSLVPTLPLDGTWRRGGDDSNHVGDDGSLWPLALPPDPTGARAVDLQMRVSAACASGVPTSLALSGLYNFSAQQLRLTGCVDVSLVRAGHRGQAMPDRASLFWQPQLLQLLHTEVEFQLLPRTMVQLCTSPQIQSSTTSCDTSGIALVPQLHHLAHKSQPRTLSTWILCLTSFMRVRHGGNC